MYLEVSYDMLSKNNNIFQTHYREMIYLKLSDRPVSYIDYNDEQYIYSLY